MYSNPIEGYTKIVQYSTVVSSFSNVCDKLGKDLLKYEKYSTGQPCRQSSLCVWHAKEGYKKVRLVLGSHRCVYGKLEKDKKK
jgi:hypothetical protein